ncbi:hypothetical protein AGMMS49957_02000 [Synergistales bacterium]|nr:hypothetical protein AGMMS49957_02000 [Synergistales bacterium]
MKKLKEFIDRYIFGKTLPTDMRLLNATYVIGTLVVVSVIAVKVLEGNAEYVVMLLALLLLPILFTIVLSENQKLVNMSNWIIILLVCGFAVPFSFFTFGGIQSGMSAYFTLCLFLIFILINGSLLWIAVAAQLLIIFFCHYAAFYYPHLIENITPYQNYIDSLSTCVICGLYIGLVAKFHKLIYDEENRNISKFDKELAKRSQMLRVVNATAMRLLTPGLGKFDESLHKCMEMLARCVSADRVYIWNTRKQKNTLRYMQIVEWVDSARRSPYTVPRGKFFSMNGIQSWEDLFADGRCVNGPVSSFSREDRERLMPFHIMSVLAIPVFLQNSFWGFVSFEDCRNERYFQEEEVAILRSGSLLMANAIARNEMTAVMREADERSRRLEVETQAAQMASKTKSAFLATMSHEIRTPLNAIIGLSEVELQTSSLNDSTRENLEKILMSGNGLLDIVNDILDISKVESGKLELVPVEYDIANLINDAVQLNIVRIGSKNIIFNLQVDETIPTKLYGDNMRVKQILNNLLSNAFKYTDEGYVIFRVEWQKKQDYAEVVFTVSDSGRGILQEHLDSLFSEYKQLDVRANRKVEGTGLGLSITKNMVEIMDGTILVDSEYGKGSKFVVKLRQKIINPTPLGAAAVDDLKKFRFAEGHGAKSKSFIRARMPYGKVLIVDDVPTNLDVAKGLMLPYGLTVDLANNAREAIDKIRAHERAYDIVFMDHMMPEIDGIEATKIIREEIGTDYARTVPIVAFTANAVEGTERLFLSNGFDSYISKPIDVLRLDRILNQFIRDKQTSQTIAEAESAATLKDTAATDNPLLGMSVAGVNIDSGVARYGGAEGYRQVLRSYIAHTPSLLEKMRALSEDDMESYAITVHGLKGSSYGICADVAGRGAEALEMASKAKDYALVSERNGDFISSIEDLVEDLKRLLRKVEERGGPKAKEHKDAVDRCALMQLLDACRRFKTTAMEEAMAGIEIYDYESDAELASWLREQLDNLEYDSIAKRLEEVLNVSERE